METQVTLNVTKGYCITPTQSILVPQQGTTSFSKCDYSKNKTQTFLVSDPEITTWADVEAMVKVSFDLNTIQIKYLDEENEEVSINSQGEYEEALKMAVKHGNQLQMKVHEGYHVDEASPSEVPEKQSVLRAGKKPLAHYSSLVRVLGSDMKVPEVPAAQQFPLPPCEANQPQDKPPDWFTSYLETFREQVVKETVEKLEQKLHEKLTLQNPSLSSYPSEVSMPISEETVLLPEKQFNWHIACSSCQRRIIGVRYQCSLCPSYNICEDCESGPYAHDSNHCLLKLRRPIVGSSELFSHHSKYSAPRLPAALEQARLQKQVDKNFLKAEKQRLRAEKKQRKAEVKELKKQLKLHRKIHLWNSLHGLQNPKSPLGRPESLLHSNTLMLPMQPCAPVMPTLSAAFVDENLPDGTHLQPGTKFTKHWRMKNTGSLKWGADTKLKFMWGNLTLASAESKDVLVPCLKAGHVGIVSVKFIAPALEGTYTSHWRLSHKGQQFGPRVWCSIVVDSFHSPESPSDGKDMITSCGTDDLTGQQEETFLLAKEDIQLDEAVEQTGGTGSSTPQKTKSAASERELYIPSVDLLTAQDLLSFELLDINIVQELERVPHNTPVDVTPCMSPLPHDSPLIEKPGLGQIQEESEGAGFKDLPDSTVPGRRRVETLTSAEETEDDLSGTQFVCETVIRSLTLDAAPDHNPPCRQKSLHKAELRLHATEEQLPVELPGFCSKESSLTFAPPEEGPLGDEKEEIVHVAEEEAMGEEDDFRDEVQSQSSTSSEDYIIILPECFDTSRPLGDSMYSSALSQTGLEPGPEEEPGVEAGQEPVEAEQKPGGDKQLQGQSVGDILMASQALDTRPLTPEVVGPPPQLPRSPHIQHHGFPGVDFPVTITEVSSATDQIRAPRSPSGLRNSRQRSYDHSRHHYQGNSIAGGLVKGALSVAASAYKALFAGPPVTAQPIVSEDQTAALMAHLFEMGFCDRQLNLRLLKTHNYNILQVVTELLQVNNNDWYNHRY